MEPAKRGLGRGIASLIPVRKEPEKERGGEILKAPLSQIVPNPQQPRKFFDETKIAELAQSIRKKGILQPLIVSPRNGRYELIAGERRFRAATLAGLQEVPIIIREGDEADKLEVALIENLQREDLDPIEEARGYEDLVDRFGQTQEEVAVKVGKDRTTVANSLRLLKLPVKLQEALRAGGLTVGHARALLGVGGIERQLYLLDRISKEGWSVRELERRIGSKRPAQATKQGGRGGGETSPAIGALLDQLRRRLGTQVRLVPSGQKGKIIIEYYSQGDLDRVINTLIRTQ